MKTRQKNKDIFPVVFNFIVNYFTIFQVAKTDASLLFNLNFALARAF